ncbi:hypothetical protein [Spirosoma oryzicola]|nr:hypothetical protein [Spirosoma oryzicola]
MSKKRTLTPPTAEELAEQIRQLNEVFPPSEDQTVNADAARFRS